MMSQPKESGSDGENRPYKDFDDGMLRGEIARLRSMVLVVGSREESALRGLREEYAVRMAEASRGVTETPGGHSLPDMTDFAEVVEPGDDSLDTGMPANKGPVLRRLTVKVGGAAVDVDDFRSRLIKALQSRDATEFKRGPLDGDDSGIDDAPSEMDTAPPRRKPPGRPPDYPRRRRILNNQLGI